MRKCLFLTAIVAVLGIARFASAGSQFPLKPEAGAWMILVQSYTSDVRHTFGERPTENRQEQLADELAATLRRDYRLPAYVFDRGAEERRKEHEKVEATRKRLQEEAKAMGLPEDTPLPKIRTVRIEDSYAVLIGGWKDMESARKALDSIRKMKPLEQKFMHQGVVLPEAKENGGGREQITGGYNPFQTAFVVHNPLLPAVVDAEQGKLQNLKEYNSDESFSLLKCKKPYTLMIKSYQGAVVLASASDTSTSFLDKITGKKSGSMLSASAKEAHELAKVFKQLKDPSGRPLIDANTEVYVLNTEYNSYLCIGGYDRPDDPKLKDYQRKLAGLDLRPAGTLSNNPMPMPVPRP